MLYSIFVTMKCYFCPNAACVLCEKCGRYVCEIHSRRMSSGRVLCLEDALGGPEGVFQEAYKTALTYAEHPTHRCSICGKKHLSQADLDYTIRSNYGLDYALVLKIKQKLLQGGVEIGALRMAMAELAGPQCHNFCVDHFPKPIRTWQTIEPEYIAYSDGFARRVIEYAAFQCPVCKANWKVPIRTTSG